MREKLIAAGLGVAAAPLASGQVLTETFDDADPGPAFVAVVDDPAALDLNVAGGRLDVLADAPVATDDALWLSAGRVSTAADFAMTIDYSLTGFTDDGSFGDGLGLVLGVGRDLDGTDAAAVSVGYGNAGGLGTLRLAGSAFRVGDAETTDAGGAAPAAGTLGVSYAAATDTLTLTAPGYSNDLVGVVAGQWAADELIFSFGARGGGFVTAPGDASLDDFVLSVGLIPEPATLTLLAAPLLMLRRTR